MAIAFIANDPLAGQPPISQITPSTARSSSQVRFQSDPLPPEDVYSEGTQKFVAWQSREAAFRTLDIFESICGKIPGWQGSSTKKTLRLIANAGQDLNAYYDRNSISFFEAAIGGKLVYSGASTDVVAHEAGHALLDALRPDFWNVSLMEVAAFHEGFGDCIAVMLALSDRKSRQALLASGASLRRANFIEATAEELSDAIGIAAGPNHNAASPRRANNSFTWTFPQSLPVDGPPGTLINEAHSLGQLASGVYYDLIAELYEALAPGEASLWAATQKATQLIVAAVSRAPVKPRFFQEWGRAMLAYDQSDLGGANQAVIKAAFSRHGFQVSAAGFLAPQMALSRRSSRRRAAAPISNSVKANLRAALNLAAGVPLSVREVNFGDRRVTEVTGEQKVDLSGLAEWLSGVTTTVRRPALVGDVEGSVAMLGSVQGDLLYSSEVRDFVATLVRRGAIEPQRGGRGTAQERRPRRETVARTGYAARKGVVTHHIVTKSRERRLERVGFACGCSLHRF
jgi:hypothetical protein